MIISVVSCVSSLYTVILYLLMCDFNFFFFFKQKTAYEIKECDWSSDVCSSDLSDDNFFTRDLPTIPFAPVIKIFEFFSIFMKLS